jgi:aminoglycoside phosphotransferase (APT) family kinase protein
MHPDEHAIGPSLVRRLVRAQFPEWADLPITPLASGGTVNAVHRLSDEGRSEAAGLAEFVLALRATKADGPPACRGGPLTVLDRATRDAVEQVRRTGEPFDARAALDVWTEALDAPTGPSGWVHADLMPSNLLVHNGHLTAVLDWATAGVGDPAVQSREGLLTGHKSR